MVSSKYQFPFFCSFIDVDASLKAPLQELLKYYICCITYNNTITTTCITSAYQTNYTVVGGSTLFITNFTNIKHTSTLTNILSYTDNNSLVATLNVMTFTSNSLLKLLLITNFLKLVFF